MARRLALPCQTIVGSQSARRWTRRDSTPACFLADRGVGSLWATMRQLGLLGWSSFALDDESQLLEDLDRAGLPAFEITGAETLARGEFVGCAQDRFRGVAAFVPDQLIGRGWGEAMLREEPLRPQAVVLL